MQSPEQIPERLGARRPVLHRHHPAAGPIAAAAIGSRSRAGGELDVLIRELQSDGGGVRRARRGTDLHLTRAADRGLRSHHMHAELPSVCCHAKRQAARWLGIH